MTTDERINEFVHPQSRQSTRGGSRIFGKGVQIYKGVGFDLLSLSHFS